MLDVARTRLVRGAGSLFSCPDCGVEAYVVTEEHQGCLWCGEVLEARCARCSSVLMPDDVSPENNLLCSYCGHLFSKDD